MSTNCIHKSVLALTTALAISSNTSQAGDGPQTRGESGPPGQFQAAVQNAVALAAKSLPAGEGGPPRQFQNLVTDDAALEAWISIAGKQTNIDENTFLGDFARRTGHFFSNQFDIILPGGERDPNLISVKLRLKDVRAIEIFNAMNLYFEVEKIPVRWKLTLNGNRPTAILDIDKPFLATAPSSEPERKHTVFAIADILYATGPDLDKQSADNIITAVEAVLDDISSRSSRGPNGGRRASAPVVKIHVEAGLLVFTGTYEETELVRSTLAALKDTALRKKGSLETEQKAKYEAALKAARKAAEDSIAPENLKK